MTGGRRDNTQSQVIAWNAFFDQTFSGCMAGSSGRAGAGRAPDQWAGGRPPLAVSRGLATGRQSVPRFSPGRRKMCVMRIFADLYAALDETTKTSEKVAALVRYLRAAAPADAAWAVYFL